MPVISGLTDPKMVKYFHQGKSDRWVAERFGISVQVVSARRQRLGLLRKPISRQANEALATRWKIKAEKNLGSHHNAHAAKSLKIYLRMRLGDASLSD